MLSAVEPDPGVGFGTVAGEGLAHQLQKLPRMEIYATSIALTGSERDSRCLWCIRKGLLKSERARDSIRLQLATGGAIVQSAKDEVV